MINIPLFLTPSHQCNYLTTELAQLVFVHPSFTMNTAIYSQLIAQGFRRSGNDIYTPHCPHCNACMPARIDVAQFQLNRNQKRCLKKNTHTIATIKPALFETAHYELYRRYQYSRHGDSNMAQSTPEDYIDFLSSHWCTSQFVEFTIADELAGVAVIDSVDVALSAVYTFFEPKFSNYSLGTYAVLWQIAQAKAQHLDFVYLGFWIKDCRKMNYKSHYQPLQVLINQQWLDFTLIIN